MSMISTPPQQEFIDQRTVRDGSPLPFMISQLRLTTAWTAFFSSVFQLLNALTLSGTTANRPTKFLYVGRPYFDTSLGAHGKPIWVASVSGSTATWIDSASNVV